MGRFIVLEGADGAGKTTQQALLGERLARQNTGHTLTSEPTAGMLGTWARTQASQMRWQTAAMVFAADRAEHSRVVIEKELRAGNHVICDRYWLSNVIYSATRALYEDKRECGRCAGLGEVEISTADDMGTCGLCAGFGTDREVLRWLLFIEDQCHKEDLLVVIDPADQDATSRLSDRGGRSSDYDRAKWQSTVRGVYRRFGRCLGSTFTASLKHPLPSVVSVDGRGSPQEVNDRIWPHIERVLGDAR
jgi:thymidylate kinase